MSGTAGNLPAGGGANVPAGNANAPAGNANAPAGNVNAPAGNANAPAGNANAPVGNIAQQGVAGNTVQQGAAAGGANPNQLQLVPPQRGGVVQFGTHQVPWTSGSPGVLQEPVSHSAFCSQDSLKDTMKSEETCQEPLGETQRLGLPDHKNNTSISHTILVLRKNKSHF